ncbi:MAG TPA: alpha-glucan family phosphorylase [Phycisphaerae bacterium]|nr:alpha-glucan family phosphorylase [Phycisphaerae bacterium]
MPGKESRPHATPAIGLVKPLAPLCELAYNLWWSWDAGAGALFESIDPGLWAAVEHNPVALLRGLSTARQRELAADRRFMAELRRTHRRMRAYLRARTWFRRQHGRKAHGCIAYFSMEYGLHESLPVFAGGLGVLAGDHFKSAGDLGLPLVGVGMFWRQGYTRQRISPAGRQSDAYDRLSPDNLPLTKARSRAGRPLRIRIPMGANTVVARAWRLDVGRTPIYLLDTHLPVNPPGQRKLTHRLYSGDRDTRIRQEMVLGIGGWRLLRALGLPVLGCHLNEGHAAFCSLERVAEIMLDTGCDFAPAARRVAAATVFTTHTPVPAGNETFDPKLVTRYFKRECQRFGITTDELLALGRVGSDNEDQAFGMTPLALRLAGRANGVSRLHGQVSRQMWHDLWPKRSVDRVPVGSITNGIHLRTWLHPRMADLLDEYLPAGWCDHQDRAAIWSAAMKIPDDRLWALHLELKAELLEFVRARLRAQLGRYRASARKTAAAGANLDPEALTIGFARRFAAYKRATLIFSDLQRAEQIINHAERPVQIIFAGKAHPADREGKALVAGIAKQARAPRFQGRVVFLEDYDMDIARHMVAGVDVWLNNPRKPQEASGTSGMKPALHGGLNLSILDGWWPEACKDGVNGWAIGTGRDHDGTEAADARDAQELYQRLEGDVVPLYYDRRPGKPPGKWIRCMKRALASIPPAFNSHRMVKEYLRRCYLPILTDKQS